MDDEQVGDEQDDERCDGVAVDGVVRHGRRGGRDGHLRAIGVKVALGVRASYKWGYEAISGGRRDQGMVRRESDDSDSWPSTPTERRASLDCTSPHTQRQTGKE